MLYLFDLDGTLISSYMDNPDKEYTRWQVLPGRRETLQALAESGHQLGIVTNQGGVAFGKVTEGKAISKLAQVQTELGLEIPYAVCFADPRSKIYKYRQPEEVARRKPSGAMITELMQKYPEAAAEGVLYVGDRPEDKQAARDAGVAFQWADDFFGSE